MKLLLDAEVIAHGALADDLTNVRFALSEPEILFQINDPKCKEWSDEPILEVQVVFNADSFVDGIKRGQEIMSGYLDYLCWITSVHFKIKRLRRLIDWDEHVDERQYRVFSDFTGPGMPYPVLAPEIIESAATVWLGTKDSAIELMVHWFASGVRGRFPENQFQFFWYGCELAATLHKGKELVHDLCQKCRGKLFL